MSKSSASRAPYALVRVKQDGSTEPVSEHQSLAEGWSAGQAAVHQDRAHAYSLYRGSRRVARLGHSRLMPRRTSFDWSVLDVR
jgi:hypothetical protein